MLTNLNFVLSICLLIALNFFNNMDTDPKFRRLFLVNGVLKDEVEWVDKETKFIDKILPFLPKYLLLKIILFSLILFFLVRFSGIFVTIIFSLITSYIKFKRLKFGIPIEVEPAYLFTIVLTLVYGLPYGLLFLLFPVTLTSLVAGFSIALIVNIWNKLLVLFGVYIFWHFIPNTSHLLVFAVALVILTDFLAYKFRLNVGQPIHEIIMTLASNSVLRLMYFSVLLETLLFIL